MKLLVSPVVRVLVLGAFAVTTAACGDPVPDALIDRLGSEASGVPVGPLHRPGQPCVACHGPDGDAKSRFSLAGTVVAVFDSQRPVGGASVVITDSSKVSFTATTNCAGNFFVREEEFVPTYPAWVTLRMGMLEREMASPWYREGSCATCHAFPRSKTSSGPVFMIEDPMTETLPPSQCN